MRTTETTGNPFFDRFWAAYPKKVGKEKARRAFEKVHPTEDQLVRMLEAITEQAVSIPGARRPENTFHTLRPG